MFHPIDASVIAFGLRKQMLCSKQHDIIHEKTDGF